MVPTGGRGWQAEAQAAVAEMIDSTNDSSNVNGEEGAANEEAPVADEDTPKSVVVEQITVQEPEEEVEIDGA